MRDVVSRIDEEEGLGGIIFWLDAVRRVVLLEVEQAACKNHDSAGQSACIQINSSPSAI
jgi:hypothetical protein